MTPATESDIPDQILKSDKLGLVRVPAERREAILKKFERSGMSGGARWRRHLDETRNSPRFRVR